jgi:purine-binding chemotaxis protein CheW
VGDEVFAVGILSVREIIEYDPPTRVPGTPAAIRGVINLRGHVVPVVDLAVRFGLPAAAVTKRTCIVIVETTREGRPTMFGLVADAVHEVLDLAAADVAPPPEFGTPVALDYLVGMGKVSGGFVLILDVGRLLPVEDLAAAAGPAPA